MQMLAWTWQTMDTHIVLTAVVAAMSCTLPGVWLVLRQQSMMGDALSHTALPGVVLAFLGTAWMRNAGWISPESGLALESVLLAGGAIAIGILTAVLTEWVQRLGRVESSAALGVVFTSLFALGLLLVRLKADQIDIDTECVLFGQIELITLDTVAWGSWRIPRAIILNGSLLLINTILLVLFYKELRISAFDPDLATSLGIPAGWINTLLMGVTAATLVMAFESVGSILVIALLIVPAASGLLLCDRLSSLIFVSLLIAAGSAVFGHVLARSVPAAVFVPLGFSEIQDAGTAGMMAVACGIIFTAVLLFAPRNGLLGRFAQRLVLQRKIAADDILTTVYRFQEPPVLTMATAENVRAETLWIHPFVRRLAIRHLKGQQFLEEGPGDEAGTLTLTEQGREQAAVLVRSHRLWESYLQKHFELPSDHLHESAHRVEHYLDTELQSQLADELDSPDTDPHGRSIPGG